MKIVVTGSRTIVNQKLIMNRFDIMFREYLKRNADKHKNDNELVIIHGAARGADTAVGLAFTSDEGLPVKYEMDGRLFSVRIVEEPLTKDDWSTYGGRAGHVRNGRMLDMEPDVVFGFWRAGLKSNGTIDCISQAAKRGILTLVQIVSETPQESLL